MEFHALVDQIQEAAVSPEQWQPVMEHLAEIAGAEGTGLIASTPVVYDLVPGKTQWISTPAVRDSFEMWLTTPELIRTNIRARLIEIREPRFLTDFDAFTLKEMDESPYYTEFMRKRGLGWCVGTTIRSPSEDLLVLSIERAYRNGPVEPEAVAKLDRLRPHLARAALFSARLGLERARATVGAFDVIGLPAAAVSSNGRAVAVNRCFGDLRPAVSIGAYDLVRFRNASIQERFQGVVSGGRDKSAGEAACSFALRAAPPAPPAVLHLLPLRGAGLDIFGNATWLMFATPVTRPKSLDGVLLQALFDLTASEAKVAAIIAAGHDVPEVCRQLNVKPSTVKVHLKAIFAKTGARRQADLVGLLSLPAQIRVP